MTRIVCVMLGGPTYRIQLGGKLRAFELHPYCGPTPINERTNTPLESIPAGFWDAIERWQIGGSRLEGDRCVVPQWCAACKGRGDEINHIGGKHWEIVGRCKSCDGKRILEASDEP